MKMIRTSLHNVLLVETMMCTSLHNLLQMETIIQCITTGDYDTIYYKWRL